MSEPIEVDRVAGLQMWADYRGSRPHLPDEGDPAVECFGDSPELADELIAFARERGWKRGVLAMARRVAGRTLAEWNEFRADVAAGRVAAAEHQGRQTFGARAR